MKKILLLLLFINLSIQLFSQIKKEVFLDSLFTKERIETCFYENTNKIKTITKYALNENSLISVSPIREYPKLYKTVFQYDKCGNLRCVTKVYFTIVSSEYMNRLRYSFNIKDQIIYGYKIKNQIINDKTCNDNWTKSLF